MSKLILFNKPFNVLSQFSDDAGRQTLANFIDIKDVYPAGRLDYDSEGLLLLTDNGQLQLPIVRQQELLAGVQLNDGSARALSCKLIEPPAIWPRVPPIRVRASIPDSWIELTINEGRNRQVRRMTAAVGLPTLRLVRAAIGDWHVSDIALGQYRTESVNLPTAKKPTRPGPRRRGA